MLKINKPSIIVGGESKNEQKYPNRFGDRTKGKC
jgi:hypothetical protein